MTGQWTLLYSFLRNKPLFLSIAPMTILSGFIASSTAFPSRKNSGFIQSPNSPIFFPENFSSNVKTTDSVVVGTTVDFTTITLYLLLFLSNLPICVVAVFI